uniref:Putative cytoplasmic dynein 2 light intermediate chain n=1 Tax=Ixodes ricinus TaxID=34613 RepID=A0A0K8RDV4_IXORI
MFGEDSFEAIDGSYPSNTKSSTLMSNSYNLVKQQFIDYFPQVEQKSVVPEDPARDPYFKEKDIDIMKAQKEKELEDYRKTREQEARAKNLLGWD